MKVLSVVGYSQTGKTTTIEKIIFELKKRNYSVGAIKYIHHHNFTLDKEGTNTYRFKMAGADIVTALGEVETAIFYKEKIDVYELLKHYYQDFVIIEGIRDINCPKILTADNLMDIKEEKDYSTYLISGKIADEINEYEGIKAISVYQDIKGLVDFIEENTFELLPDYSEDYCNLCGYSCRKLCELILKGEKDRSHCLLKSEF